MDLDRLLGLTGIGPRSRALRGMIFMLISAFFGVVMSALIRGLSSDLHPFVIAFFRSLFGAIIFIPMLARYGVQPFRTGRPGRHFIRGLTNVAVILSSFMALSLAPLAKVTALHFTSPLFSTLLAVLLLGEVIRAHRIAALVLGFAGTLAIVRPGIDGFDLGSSLAIVSALAGAISTIVVKELSRTESSVTTVMYMSLVASPMLLLCALPVWRTPTPTEFMWLLALGLVGTITHLTTNQALKETDVSYTQTMRYTQLIWAAVVGYLAFGEIPDIWTWIGGIMVAVSAAYIGYREHREMEAQARKKGSTGVDP
ncbi:MAG: DMT family transporter [Rhodospirillales bacterium]|nr:DMT family transporter [Rhodospirillales bacterium]